MGDHQVSCRDALAELWAFIDRELDQASAEEVRAHLDRCRSCFPQYDFQRAFRAFMATQARTTAPPELRRRIFLKLLSEEGRTDGPASPA
jgi:anti-sigma factor (TIGR02949 family)